MKIVALAGGVGGAKLVHGLAQILAPEDLTVIVNTGDDFMFLGLKICPDLDTVCYTLAGLSNPETGWGRVGETWNAMENFVKLGGPDWFHLGDKDMGTHIERTRRITNGEPLSAITRDFCSKWGIKHTVLPMTDDIVATWVSTDNGWLPFQEYFVKEKCIPRVNSFKFLGIEQAMTAPGVMEAIEAADWIIVCPSNPWVSVAPILKTANICEMVCQKPIVAVSPIIGGKAVKGPAAKMYSEMGMIPSAVTVMNHYHSLFTGCGWETDDLGNSRMNNFVFYIDSVDAELASSVQETMTKVIVTNTIMDSIEKRKFLAEEILKFIHVELAKLRG